MSEQALEPPRRRDNSLGVVRNCRIWDVSRLVTEAAARRGRWARAGAALSPASPRGGPHATDRGEAVAPGLYTDHGNGRDHLGDDGELGRERPAKGPPRANRAGRGRWSTSGSTPSLPITRKTFPRAGPSSRPASPSTQGRSSSSVSTCRPSKAPSSSGGASSGWSRKARRVRARRPGWTLRFVYDSEEQKAEVHARVEQLMIESLGYHLYSNGRHLRHQAPLKPPRSNDPEILLDRAATLAGEMARRG